MKMVTIWARQFGEQAARLIKEGKLADSSCFPTTDQRTATITRAGARDIRKADVCARLRQESGAVMESNH